MRRLYYECIESLRIAWAEILANKMRSTLTALGVIIGIVAVTLMGAAICGINTGFQNSLSFLGDDVLYVEKWPWRWDNDWWSYANRPLPTVAQVMELNHIIQDTEESLLDFAVPVSTGFATVRVGGSRGNRVVMIGSTADYARLSHRSYREGRFFTYTEAVGCEVCILGCNVADALFPGCSPLYKRVLIEGQPFTVIGVYAKHGEIINFFSFDNQVVVPLRAFAKCFGMRYDLKIEVKVVDKNRIPNAKEELVGAMRRVRGQLPGEHDNFSINDQQAFKRRLNSVKGHIAFVGLFITGFSLFVGGIGIANVMFVSVKERTKEIGTRKALGARRCTILLQFLVEAVSICFIGGVVGMVISFMLFLGIKQTVPSLPVEFSPGLVATSMMVSAITGVVSGFLPAYGASRLDPVVALRYE